MIQENIIILIFFFRQHFLTTNFLDLGPNSRSAGGCIDFIKQMSTFHASLCDTMDTVNHCYSLQVMIIIAKANPLNDLNRVFCFKIMLTMGSIFFFSVFTFFIFFRFVINSNEFVEHIVKIRVTIFLFFIVYMLVILNMGSVVPRQVSEKNGVIRSK